MSAAPSQAAQFESDREQLIEGQPFNHDEELVMQNNLRNKMEQSQRRHLIGIAVTVPALKGILCWIILAIIVKFDILGEDLKHPQRFMQRGEAVFLYTIVTIPMTAIILGTGLVIYSDYPKISCSTISEYLWFRGSVLFVEIIVWAVYLTQFTYFSDEMIAIVLFGISEFVSLIFLKLFSTQQRNFDPVDGPSSMEMGAIKSNLPIGPRPVPHLAPADIENS